MPVRYTFIKGINKLDIQCRHPNAKKVMETQRPKCCRFVREDIGGKGADTPRCDEARKQPEPKILLFFRVARINKKRDSDIRDKGK